MCWYVGVFDVELLSVLRILLPFPAVSYPPAALWEVQGSVRG